MVARLFAVREPLPLAKSALRSLAATLTPSTRTGDFAQAMMDLGATICTPKSPSCMICPWTEDCSARIKGIAASLPLKATKAKVSTRFGHVFWIENMKGDVLVRTRASKGLLGGMTEFPSSDWVVGQRLKFAAPFEAEWKKLTGLVEHTFTHFHLELNVWKTVVANPILDGRFVKKKVLATEALPSLMRKVAVLAMKTG